MTSQYNESTKVQFNKPMHLLELLKENQVKDYLQWHRWFKVSFINKRFPPPWIMLANTASLELPAQCVCRLKGLRVFPTPKQLLVWLTLVRGLMNLISFRSLLRLVSFICCLGLEAFPSSLQEVIFPKRGNQYRIQILSNLLSTNIYKCKVVHSALFLPGHINYQSNIHTCI